MKPYHRRLDTVQCTYRYLIQSGSTRSNVHENRHKTSQNSANSSAPDGPVCKHRTVRCAQKPPDQNLRKPVKKRPSPYAPDGPVCTKYWKAKPVRKGPHNAPNSPVMTAPDELDREASKPSEPRDERTRRSGQRESQKHLEASYMHRTVR